MGKGAERIEKKNGGNNTACKIERTEPAGRAPGLGNGHSTRCYPRPHFSNNL